MRDKATRCPCLSLPAIRRRSQMETVACCSTRVLKTERARRNGRRRAAPRRSRVKGKLRRRSVFEYAGIGAPPLRLVQSEPKEGSFHGRAITHVLLPEKKKKKTEKDSAGDLNRTNLQLSKRIESSSRLQDALLFSPDSES